MLTVDEHGLEAESDHDFLYHRRHRHRGGGFDEDPIRARVPRFPSPAHVVTWRALGARLPREKRRFAKLRSSQPHSPATADTLDRPLWFLFEAAEFSVE